MDYNFNDNLDLLEKHLDGLLSGEEKRHTEQLLREDTRLQEEYAYMKLAVSAVRLSALHNQVGNVANAYASKDRESPIVKSMAKVRNISHYTLRAASVLLIAAASYMAVMYATVTPRQLYSDTFIDYELSTSRSISQGTIIERNYGMGSWQEVLTELSEKKLSSQKDLFLGGIAALQLNEAVIAGDYFKKVLTKNNISSNKLYQEESEFYLALTYLKMNNYKSAGLLLHAIRIKPDHLYHEQVKKISLLKTTLLGWKY